jgi:hypothetical protein
MENQNFDGNTPMYNAEVSKNINDPVPQAEKYPNNAFNKNESLAGTQYSTTPPYPTTPPIPPKTPVTPTPLFGKKEEPKRVFYDKNKLEADVLGFLKGKSGKIKLNDYLKTLFPVYPNQAANIGDSRYMRHILDKLQSENKIKMYNNSHDKLGDTYYPNNGIQSAQYNLDTCSIEVE